MGKHVDVKAFADKVAHKHGIHEDTLRTIGDVLKQMDGKSKGLIK
jgi:hypothetical protein